MNLQFDPRYEDFRQEVRTFLEDALDDELRRGGRLCPGTFQEYPINIRWHRILHKKGWIAPSWPVKYGGTGWDLVQRAIWAEECVNAQAPSVAPMGLAMCGPMLIGHGSEEQKAQLLPRILSGEDYWCQGYSEPGSGSDLASLSLRADIDGDDYILNGTKIWTTHAHYANKMFLLVRTDSSGKPQTGITFLLLDMDSPGINVEPIRFVSGEHEVNQVFFENVRVPRANRVGKENDGWTVAKYLLEFERGGGSSPRMLSALKRLNRLAEETGAATEPDFQSKMVQAQCSVAALRATEQRMLAAMSRGESPGPESSILKNLGADLGQHISALAVEALGIHGMAFQGEQYNPAYEPPAGTARPDPIGPESGLVTVPQYLNYRASSIAGGTNEVQKNIVAKLVLGL